MTNEREKIKAMLAEGTLTPAEAAELLAALPPDPAAQPPAPRPALPARGEAWRAPFGVAVLFTGIGGAKLLFTRKSGGLLRFLRTFLIWPFTILAGLAALLMYLNRDAPWLHVRLQDEDGEGLTISLPFIAPAVRRGLALAREQTNAPEALARIHAANEALDEFASATAAEPLLVDIEGEDGRVQVYLK